MTQRNRSIFIKLLNRSLFHKWYFTHIPFHSADVKVNSPDYEGSKYDETVSAFYTRIANYEKYYVTLDELRADEEKSFIKVYNCGIRFLLNNISGNVQSKIVYYLMNMNARPRTIYLSRHGESQVGLLGDASH